MRSEAFGEIGLLPKDFYRMAYDDYLLLHKGFIRKREYDQAVLRKAVEIVIAPWLSKRINIRTIWPLGMDHKDISEAADRALTTLNRLKNNNITYVKVGNKIVEVENKPKEN